MKKNIKYKKIDSWCYTTSDQHSRRKIKRLRSKKIRQLTKNEIQKDIENSVI